MDNGKWKIITNMSKIGKQPIEIKDGVTVSIDGQVVTVKGPKGEESHTVARGIKASVIDGKLVITQDVPNDIHTRPMFGLTRALLANIVTGVNTGFEKRLELAGVGYRAQMQGEELVLNVGFSHPVKFKPDSGVKISVAENIITISGISKAMVGEIAAEIRSTRPPEPYKGKGIKYVGEHVRRKAGKAAKAVGTK
jgi:large subunit ribosomal protein L6